MDISIVYDKKSEDLRVPLTPGAVSSIVSEGNDVYFLKGAGIASGFSDRDYELKGAKIAYTEEEIYKRGEIIVSVTPVPLEALSMIKRKATIMSFQHLAVASEKYLDLLIEREITTIGFEVISDDRGELIIEAATGEIAGALSVQIAANYLQTNRGGRGIMLGGAPGIEPANLLIIGAGSVGRSAARTASAMGARVLIIDRNVEKLRLVEEAVGKQVATGFSSSHAIAGWIKNADVVIGAVYLKGAKSPVVVSEEMIKSMRKGSVAIDLSIDQGGCVETSRPTTLSNPVFEHSGVIHYCVPNVPSLAAKASSQALSHALFPYLIDVGKRGEGYLKEMPSLGGGTYTHRGRITMKVLAELFNREYSPIEAGK